MTLRHATLAIGLAFLAGCTACATTPNWPVPPRRILVDDIVADAMFEIQREYEVETVRCLIGYVDAGTIYVETMVPTKIVHSDSVSARFEGCPVANAVGYYHNHPGRQGYNGTMIYYCVPSSPDVNTLDNARNMWVAVITCNATRTLVWQFKHDSQVYRWPPAGTVDSAGTLSK